MGTHFDDQLLNEAELQDLRKMGERRDIRHGRLSIDLTFADDGVLQNYRLCTEYRGIVKSVTRRKL